MSALQNFINRWFGKPNPDPTIPLAVADDGSADPVVVGKQSPLRADPTTGALLVKDTSGGGGGGGGGGEVTQGAGSGTEADFWTVRVSNGSAFIPFPLALGAGGGFKIDGSGTALPVSGTVTITPSGTQTIATASQAASAYLPVRMTLDGSNYPAVTAVGSGVAVPSGTIMAVGAWAMFRTYSSGTAGAGYSPQCDTSGRVVVTHNRVSRTAHLASTTLPAAGAFTSQTAYTVPEGVVGVTAYVTYTPGTTGGTVLLRPEYGNGTETARESIAVSSSASSENIRDTLGFREFVSPSASGTFKIDFDLPYGCTTFRLLAAELGVTATPGTCAITLTAKYGS